MAAEPGTMVSPTIRLVRPLGAGGMGAVWLADHLALRTQVVVKLIAEGLAKSPTALARFSHEAAAASQVKSPHVVQMLDFGVTPEGTPYIVMELLEGHDLGEELRRTGPMPLRRFAALFEQMASALSRAHERGVIHRDVKPENIFLCDVGQTERFVKVLDFGIAKGGGTEGDRPHTHTGASIGTPYYMSPEQMSGARDIDHRADIWSLGVVAFQALTGERPFNGETYFGIGMAITQAPMRPPSQVNPALPPTVDAWYFKACARDPRERFASANEMAKALTAIATSAPTAGTVPAAPATAVSGGSWNNAWSYQATAVQMPALTPPTSPSGTSEARPQSLPAVTGPSGVSSPNLAVTGAKKSSMPLILGIAAGILVLGGTATVLAVLFLLPKHIDVHTRRSAAATSTAERPVESGHAPVADEIRFTKVPYAVGSAYDETDEIDEKLQITAPQATSQSLAIRATKKVAILGTDGNALTRVKVTYEKMTRTITKPAQAPEEKPVPLNGKTYLIEASGGVVTILDEHRAPVTPMEDGLVRAEWGMIGRPEPLLTAVPDVPVKRGQEVDSIAEMMKQVLSGSEIVEFDDAHAVLKEITTEGKDRIGVFEFRGRMRGRQGTNESDVDWSGTIAIRASDSRVVRYNFAGPKRMSGNVEATGSASTKATITDH